MKLRYTLPALIAIATFTIPEIAGAAENGIARLNYAGLRKKSHCTASLIEPSKVLTARHCIEKRKPKDLYVVFGYDRGDWAEVAKVKSLHPHKSEDIAILCLTKKSKQKPLPLGDTTTLEKLAQAKVVGYRRSKAHIASSLTCALQTGKSKARMECPVEPGMSGSPVRVDGKIIAVMAATAKAFSIATLINDLPEVEC